MRRSVFEFAIVTSLLMLACAAAGQNIQTSSSKKDSDADVLGGLKETLKEFMDPFLTNGVFSSFKPSSLFGLFDQALEEVNSYGKDVEVLHEQSLKEYKDIESIRTLAQAAAEKATKSGALTQKINFITARAETGKAQKAEIEKQRGIVQSSRKEADAAKKKFEDKEAELSAIVVKVVAYLTGAGAANASPPPSSTPGLMDLVKQGAPIAAEMYASFKTFDKASAQSREAFQEAKLASKTIKQYLTESQEIQTCLNA